MTTIFAPAAPSWRLLPASDRAAARICGLVLALAVVYGLTTLIYTVTRVAHSPFALTIAVTLPSSLLAAGLIIAILRTPLEPRHEDELPSIRWVKALSLPIWALAVAIIVTALTGYLALTRFLAQQLIVTGSILAVVYLLLLWVDGFGQGLGDESTVLGRWLKQAAGIEERRREQLTVPISLFRFAPCLLSWCNGVTRGPTSSIGTGSCSLDSTLAIPKYRLLPWLLRSSYSFSDTL